MPTPRKIRAAVEQVTAHTPDVFTLVMRPDKRTPPFRAGQFLHIALDEYDPATQWPDSRVFSIANAPTRTDTIRITFAVKGPFTNEMSRLHVGNTVWLKLPYGSFYLEPEPGKQAVLIAGGTGITPFISFLELACDQRCDSPVTLFFGVRRPELILYESLLEECRTRLPNFSLHLFVEQDASGRPANALPGMLDLERILARVADPKAAVFYLAGPPPMIDAFTNGLRQHGIPEQDIRIDQWE